MGPLSSVVTTHHHSRLWRDVCTCVRVRASYPRDRGGRVVHATRPSTISTEPQLGGDDGGWWGVYFKSGAANLIKSSGVCAAACAAVA